MGTWGCPEVEKRDRWPPGQSTGRPATAVVDHRMPSLDHLPSHSCVYTHTYFLRRKKKKTRHGPRPPLERSTALPSANRHQPAPRSNSLPQAVYGNIKRTDKESLEDHNDSALPCHAAAVTRGRGGGVLHAYACICVQERRNERANRIFCQCVAAAVGTWSQGYHELHVIRERVWDARPCVQTICISIDPILRTY